jgi:hypothetical protein
MAEENEALALMLKDDFFSGRLLYEVIGDKHGT